MQESIEYLFLGLFLVLIIGFSLTNVATVSTMASREISRNQLSAEAESMLGLILLYPGDPIYWNCSSGPNQITSFGLALADRSQPYVLDGSKVLALNRSEAVRARMLELLSVRKTYGLYLKISPAYIVDITAVSKTYTVTVRSFRGPGIPNVNVTGYQGEIGQRYQAKGVVTNLNGTATLNFTGIPGSILVVHASLFGVEVAAAYPSDANCTVAGDYIIATDHPLAHEVKVLYGGVLENNSLKLGAASSVSLYRQALIDGSAYLIEFTFWRMSE